MIENKNMSTHEWKDIGVIGVDTGKIIITDPANVLTHRELEELREKEKNAKLPSHIDFKHGIVSKTGFGEGSYHVFAKMEDDGGNMIKRITEIRIVFDGVMNNNDFQKIPNASIKEPIENTHEKKHDLSKGVKL
jgi:hypothetical protein